MAPVTTSDAIRLRAELGHEVIELARVRDEILGRRAQRDDTTTYALALLLMNYYTGAERIFRRVANQLGGIPPAGDRWHLQLLQDMALELPGIRPAILAQETMEQLGRLLRLRHVLRNLYAWSVRREELDSHLAELEAIHVALAADMSRFDAFLGALAER